MAFPVIAGHKLSNEATPTTSHTVDLPAGIVLDELLIVQFITDDTTITFPGGWTSFFDIINAGNLRMVFYYRRADGGEGASITVTTAASAESGHLARRITGYEDPATQAPEGSAGATGNSNSPDPDSLTPTGGAKDYLWIACVGDISAFINGPPTNYSVNNQNSEGSNRRCGSVGRNLNAASEDPGTYPLGAVSEWGAGTLAIHPGALPLPPAVGGWGWDWQWSKFKAPEPARTF